MGRNAQDVRRVVRRRILREGINIVTDSIRASVPGGSDEEMGVGIRGDE